MNQMRSTEMHIISGGIFLLAWKEIIGMAATQIALHDQLSSSKAMLIKYPTNNEQNEFSLILTNRI
jgi:hypothetical protein